MLQRYITELLGGEKYVSCSVVLPARRRLLCTMDVRCWSSVHSPLQERIHKGTQQKKREHEPGLVKSSLSFRPPFKSLRYLPRADTAQVRQNLMICWNKELNPRCPGMKRFKSHQQRSLFYSWGQILDEGLDTDNPSRRFQSRALREHWHMSMLIVVPAVN